MNRITRTTVTVIAGLIIVALACAATPAGAEQTPTVSTSGTSSPTVDPKAAEAMADQQHLTVAEATRRLKRQGSQHESGKRLERQLGHRRTGGSYLDDKGELVVTTTDATADVTVRNGKAKVRRVDDSAERLDSIVAALDAQAKAGGAGAVQSWMVDVPANSVKVTTTIGATDPVTNAMLAVARSFGTSVVIAEADPSVAPTATGEYLYGGLEYGTPNGKSCSTGFNTLDAWNRNVILTAGHCVPIAGNATRGGYILGAVRTVNFRQGDDFGTIWNQTPSYFVPRSWVWLYNNTYAAMRGVVDNPMIGSTVCKSGKTTGYTCGIVRAKNVSVTFDGAVVSGLVRHTACVEPGDSGGANFSPSFYAMGITSAAGLRDKTWCQSRFGYENESYYQPVLEALNANGLRLIIN